MDLLRYPERLGRCLKGLSLVGGEFELFFVMMDDILIGRATLDESGCSVGGQDVVPEICEVRRDFEAKKKLTNNSDMMKTRHQFTVILSHGISHEVPAPPVRQEVIDVSELFNELVVGDKDICGEFVDGCYVPQLTIVGGFGL